MFLPVSTDEHYRMEGFDSFGDPIVHTDCGSAWRVMFTNEFHNWVTSLTDPNACGHGAFPQFWIAGGVAAVGLVVAFWGGSRGRLLRLVGGAVLATGLMEVLGWLAAISLTLLSNMGGE